MSLRRMGSSPISRTIGEFGGEFSLVMLMDMRGKHTHEVSPPMYATCSSSAQMAYTKGHGTSFSTRRGRRYAEKSAEVSAA